ncbi:hypothetical protein KKC1_15420 [Calderihabitans maritimus]|uniref:Uncharacterized protein n=1 Tax=Calderihabitans maritimus TaxID=1246530 RepID=A0A1Z5HSI7_9FIRM|nr:hypothetical protein KKC1_15420 [Calderihabitans maritimus]
MRHYLYFHDFPPLPSIFTRSLLFEFFSLLNSFEGAGIIFLF